MEVKTIIGVDPGASGGIAVYNYKSGLKVVKMPKSIAELSEYFKFLKETYENPICFLEKVNSFKSDKNDAGKNFGIDKLLANFEQLKTVLTIVGIPFVLVYPQSWQGGLKLKKKGEEKTQRKQRYKAAAAKYYPEVKPTLWSADAICILHFGRVKFNTDIKWIQERLPENTDINIFT